VTLPSELRTLRAEPSGRSLSKRYRIVALQRRYDTLRDQIADAFTAPFRRIAAAARRQPSAVRGQDEIIWALKTSPSRLALSRSKGQARRSGGHSFADPSLRSGLRLRASSGPTGLRRERTSASLRPEPQAEGSVEALSRTAGKTTLTSTGSVQGSRSSPASPSHPPVPPQAVGRPGGLPAGGGHRLPPHPPLSPHKQGEGRGGRTFTLRFAQGQALNGAIPSTCSLRPCSGQAGQAWRLWRR